MISHLFYRFYVVTKFILQSIGDIKISPITFDIECSYLHIKLDKITHTVKHHPNIRYVCSKILPFIYYYKKQVDSYNNDMTQCLYFSYICM